MFSLGEICYLLKNNLIFSNETFKQNAINSVCEFFKWKVKKWVFEKKKLKLINY